LEHLTDAVKCSNHPQETRHEALQQTSQYDAAMLTCVVHTIELPGIDTGVARQLETDFDCLEGPESVSLDGIHA
jgi:hypothetical protein